VTALGNLGPDARAAIGPLIVIAYNDSEALAKQRAAQSLEVIGRGGKESISGLVDNFKHNNSDIRRQSVIAIGQAQAAPADTAAALSVAVKDPATPVKLAAVQILGEQAKSYAPAINLLRPALFDNDKTVRPVAIALMGEAAAAPDAAALALEEVLKDSDPTVRSSAIDALSRLGPPAVPVLLREMTDSYAILAEKAVQAILAIGPEAIPALEKAKAGKDLFFQKAIPPIIAALQATPTRPRRK
jgi:HEAT repeat protein